MRILLYSDYHVSEYVGGNEIYADLLAKELIKQKHQVTYVCLKGKTQQLPYRVMVNKWTWLNKVELIHSIGSGFGVSLVGFWSRWKNIPRVWTFQGPVNSTNLIKKWLGKWDEQLNMRNYRNIITTSPLNASYLAKYGYTSEVYVIFLAQRFNHIKTNKSRATLRKQLGWNDKEKIILWVGRTDKHHYYKGIEVAHKAVKLVKKAVRLIVVDGKLSDNQLVDYYRAADIFLNTSTSTSEGFGLTIIEAMRFRLPVITTKVVGISPMLISNKLAIVIEPKDINILAQTIEKFVDADLTAMITRAHKFATSLNITKMVKKTVAIYQKAVKN